MAETITMADVITEARDASDQVWSDRIKEALTATGGNKTRAYKLLGMPKRSFFRKLHEYGLMDWRADGDHTTKD